MEKNFSKLEEKLESLLVTIIIYRLEESKAKNE